MKPLTEKPKTSCPGDVVVKGAGNQTSTQVRLVGQEGQRPWHEHGQECCQTERLAQRKEGAVGDPLQSQKQQHEGDGHGADPQGFTAEVVPQVGPQAAEDVVVRFEVLEGGALLNEANVEAACDEGGDDAQRENEAGREGHQP